MQLNNPALFRQQAYINGTWLDADSKATMEVTNPANGEVIGSIPDLTGVETARAIEAARVAMISWRKQTAKQRAAIMRVWFDLIMANQDDLGKIMTLEQGKPLAEAKGEIGYAASFIDWFAEEGKRIYGDIIPTHKADARIVVTKEPIGVVAAITPWNFPTAMITRKCGPALAAGCGFVVRPASETPFSALALAVLAEEAGIPAGLFNVITGQSRPIGAELTSNPTVRKLTFTGSTPVGKLLMQQCAPTLKKVSLELGGNAPFIVFDDADLDSAVAGAVAGKYRNAGQTCVCVNRFIVQEGVYDAFVAKFAEKVAQLQVGNGMDEGVTQGPMINQGAIDKVKDHIEDALSKGGKLICGGQSHTLGGSFFTPTIIGNATTDMKMATEETFGPVAPIFKFKDEAQAIAMANDTEFGLAAY
ncbi:NAD-dependent succinate-semialdehyde dehydrogenase, partial [Oceanospirillaceae bacterium]|nr:NAD-dependent succinate-semialdehyde dehydrogenase [Oceanospirillaceae bacterium]